MTTRVVRVLTNTLGGGGAEKQLLLSVLGLSQRGVKCQVFALHGTDHSRYRALVDACRAAGAEFHMPARAGAAAMTAVVLRLLVSVVKGPAGILWLWGYYAQLVHLITPVLWIPRTVASLRLADPQITRAQGWVTRLGAPFISTYVSNSQRAVDYTERYVRNVRRKARVIPNAIESSWLDLAESRRSRPAPRRLCFGMLANVRYLMKGYDVALTVAERIRALSLPVHIRIGGRQYAGEPNLADEIARRGLSEIVCFEGVVEAPEKFFASCDGFLLLSRFEGMPNALMEAMAAGLPCIATDVGDIARFREHSDCVRVVPIMNADAVINLLREWVENWNEAEELGRRAHHFAREQFAVSTMLDRVEAAFGWRDSPARADRSARDKAAA